jgi:hypothetical protein
MVTQSAISHDDGLVADRKPTPIIRDADQLLRRGIEVLEHDRFEEAAGLLQQAVDLAPDSPMASLALGITLCQPAANSRGDSGARKRHRARSAGVLSALPDG